ncbi:MAG: hypothetical protein WBM14_13685, partial [Terracidiphilus sp.]
FCAAQRFLTASAMRFRPSGLRFRFFFLTGFAAGTVATFLDAAAAFFGLPTYFFAVGATPPLSNARARCN